MPHRPTRDVDLLGFGASDLDSIAQAFREALDAGTLASAIAATFARRGTPLPTELPIGLSDEFANDGTRHALWAAFLRKNALEATPLQDVVGALRAKLQPVLCTPMP